MSVHFLAEIKQILLKKTHSLDHEVEVKLITDDKTALELASNPPNKIFKVTVEEE